MTDHIKALIAAQKAMEPARKASDNPHFGSKYADLSAVQDACFPALNDNGFAVMYINGTDEIGAFVDTVFLHESGEKFETRVPLTIDKPTMQGLGSAITYARRYGLMSLAGIAPEDDDGNAAEASPATRGLRRASEDAADDAITEKRAADFADKLIAKFANYKSKDGLEAAWEKNAKTVSKIAEAAPATASRIRGEYMKTLEAFRLSERENDFGDFQ